MEKVLNLVFSEVFNHKIVKFGIKYGCLYVIIIIVKRYLPYTIKMGKGVVDGHPPCNIVMAAYNIHTYM